MLLCDVYKSGKKNDLYLYVDRAEGLQRVPEALLSQFGEATLAISFELKPDRRLAREDPAVVIRNLQEHGYHLQLPPAQYEPK